MQSSSSGTDHFAASAKIHGAGHGDHENGCAADDGWSVAVFAARETIEVLRATINAAVAAALAATAAGHPVRTIDVLVNGNAALADAAAAEFAAAVRHERILPRPVPAPDTAPRIRIWQIAFGDKAHAWNEYLHRIWPGSTIAFFIDGYVRLAPDALWRLGARVAASPEALGGSGVPTVGRKARHGRRCMASEGGIQGNCCCVTRAAIEQIVRTGFRFPVGLYRADALLGAVLAFRMDPARHAWDVKRAVAVAPDASWQTDPKRWWRLDDIRATWRRRDRQAQGELENLAVRDHLALRRQPPERLPETAAELVLEWAARCPDAVAEAVRGRPRIARALERFRCATYDSSALREPPRLLSDEKRMAPAA